MKVDTSLIQQLRELTGAGMMDAKRALEKTGGDLTQAVEVMRRAGQKIAAKKQDRATREGTIGVYAHSSGKLVSCVSVACESDFVAKNAVFTDLAHELAMQVAATEPTYVAPADVPADIISHETSILREQLQREGKPAKIWEKIIRGKLQKFYAETCLLQQPYIKDDSLTVEQLIHAAVLKLGENIQVKSFTKVTL
ncbi:MAG: translation elongation factor Ts [Patescibacteria group bacterium]